MADAKIATVRWQGGLVFEGAANSGIPARMDGQAKDGISPMEMVVLGLAGCTGADVIDILRKKRQAVTALEIRVTGQRAAEQPHKYTDMEVAYLVTGRNIDPAAVARAIELSETKYCSVAASLRGAVTITSTYTIRDVEPAVA